MGVLPVSALFQHRFGGLDHGGDFKENSFKWTKKSAQKVFDRADIVIALGKRGRGGTEDETVKTP
jgi:hypothetical protein